MPPATRIVLLSVVVAFALLAAQSPVRAGGFELVEQSPEGVATVGAQTAVVDGPSAVYYNPAALATQHGLGAQVGVNVLHTDVQISVGSARPGASGTVATPTAYVSQRLGAYFGVGVGVFSNFVEHLEYPSGWAGRHSGTFFDLTTTTINPSVAIRPHPRISVGFGIDVVPASLDLRRDAVLSGGPTSVPPLTDANLHFAGTAVGLGANVGVLVTLVPRYLSLGATYRSPVDLDFGGRIGFDAPAGAGFSGDAKMTVPLPQSFTIALGSRPLAGLTLDVDAHLALWRDLSNLTESATAPTPLVDDKNTLTLNQRDSWGVRAGGEYRVLEEKLRVRLGVGYDSSPVRRGWLQPLTPDSSRVVVGVGLGYQLGVLTVDVGYSAQIVLARTSSNPDPGMATYSAVRHVLALTVSARLPDFGGRVNVPEYRH